MSSRNHSRGLLLATLLASACADSGGGMISVQPEAYSSRNCWFNEGGYFEAYLVVGGDNEARAPYVVSTRCLVNDFSNNGEATIYYLDKIRLVDSNGALDRALPGANFTDTLRSHPPQPTSSSSVYYMRATVSEVPGPFPGIYAPVSIGKLADIGMSFERFLGLSREERERLLREYNR